MGFIDKKRNHCKQYRADAARVINAQENYVIPGMIDSHAHIASGTGEMKSGDTYLSGSIAAAYGGTTSFIDFALKKARQRLLDLAADNLKAYLAGHPKNIVKSLNV